MFKYTLSDRAYNSLVEKLTRPQSRMSQWRHANEMEIDAFGRPTVVNATQQTNTYRQGLSWALTCLVRSFDLDEWTAKPDKHTGLFYDPVDMSYLASIADDPDPTPLTPRQLDDLNAEKSLLRHSHTLALDKSARAYYSNLLVKLHISLPTKPTAYNPVIAKQRDNLTTRVSFCLEAIGTGHIGLPVTYRLAVDQPNLRKARTAKQGKGRRLYGNKTGEAYMPKEWRRLPADLSNWTQQDVDYALLPHVKLLDLACEACQLNPSLSLPSNLEGLTSIQQKAVADTRKAQAKPERWTLPYVQAPHTYKGRDVTEAVLQAYTLYYEKGIPFTAMTHLCEDYKIPYNNLRILTHREAIQRRSTIPVEDEIYTPVKPRYLREALINATS